MTGLSLEAVDISVRFGALRVLQGVSFTVDGPERIGLIGPNGAGKTTLLSVISGFVAAGAGQVLVDGDDVTGLAVAQRVSRGILRTFQTARLLEDETVETNIMLGCHSLPGPGTLRELVATRGALRWSREVRGRTRTTARMVGLGPDLHRPVSTLPSATRRLVEIARVLVAEPRLLLLDEPAAGLDATERVQLGEMLVQAVSHHPCLLVLVEHDVAIVRAVCSTTLVLAAGRLLAAGPTDEVLRLESVRTAYFGGGTSAAHA